MLVKRTLLLLLCLQVIYCQEDSEIISQKAKLAQKYQCEITNSVDYLIQMQFNSTLKILTSSSFLEIKTDDIMNIKGNFIQMLSKLDRNILFQYNEQIQFLEINEQKHSEMNIQEIVFKLNQYERLYLYVMSFVSSNVKVIHNKQEFQIQLGIQSDMIFQVMFASPVQVNIPTLSLNNNCKEDTCKIRLLRSQELMKFPQKPFIEQSIQKAEFQVDSYFFEYVRYMNIYLARIVSQNNVTHHLSIPECEFENNWNRTQFEINYEVFQYLCWKNEIKSQVISLTLRKSPYQQVPQKQVNLLVAFEIPLGHNLDLIIEGFIERFEEMRCDEKFKYIINAAFVQIKQTSVESQYQFSQYNQERQVQQESIPSEIKIEPFQNFIISDTDDNQQVEVQQTLQQTYNLDQKPVYKTLNGIYTPSVPDYFLNFDSDNENQNKQEEEANEQQSLIQKEEEPVQVNSDFIIFEDPISWNDDGEQEVEVFGLDQTEKQDKVNTMVMEQAKVEEVNFDQIPANQQYDVQLQPQQEIQPQFQVQEPQQQETNQSSQEIIQPQVQQQTNPQVQQLEQETQQQSQQSSNDSIDQHNTSNEYSQTDYSDYSDYYGQYSEDYDNYYRHLHHNHQLKHNFHHHRYNEVQRNNLRSRRNNHDNDDTLPIVANRIIMEYNFANKVKKEEVKMHGDDQFEEEEKEENENVRQKKPRQVEEEQEEEEPKQNNKQSKKSEQKEDQEDQGKMKQDQKKQQKQPQKNEEEEEEKQQGNKKPQQKAQPSNQNKNNKSQDQDQEEEEEQDDKPKENKRKPSQSKNEEEEEQEETAPRKKQQSDDKPKENKRKPSQSNNEEEEEQEETASRKKQQSDDKQKENKRKSSQSNNEEEEEQEETAPRKKQQSRKSSQNDIEEEEEQEQQEPSTKKKQQQKQKQKKTEENEEAEDEGNADKEEEEEKQEEAASKKKKQKQEVEDEEECDEQENAEEKEEQNNDEAQQDEAENEQDECHCEKKKKKKEDEEEKEEEQEREDEEQEADEEQESKKNKKKKKGKKKSKDEEEEEGQYDYYGRYVRNHPYFENRNRRNIDEDMYWRYRCMNRQARGYPFNWNPYQHRRNHLDTNVFNRMNPYRFTPNYGWAPNTIRQRYSNQGMPIYRGVYSNQEQMLRELAYKHAQQQYAKQQVQQYRDQVGYFNCYGQDYYRPEYYESYQGVIADDPRYQVINRNINDPNVFSPFDESVYYKNAQPRNTYNNNNLTRQNIRFSDSYSNNCFQVFDQCNFQGKRINLCGENPLLPQDLNGFKIFSYIVPQNVEIKFTQPQQNQGELSTLEGSQECLQSPYQLIPHIS